MCISLPNCLCFACCFPTCPWGPGLAANPVCANCNEYVAGEHQAPGNWGGLTPPDCCRIPRFRMAPGAVRRSSCVGMLSIKLDKGRYFCILLVVLEVLCTSLASDKWELRLYLGPFLPSLPACLWCLVSKTNGNCWTFPGSPEGVWFYACAVLCSLTGMPPLPCVPGSVPWQSQPPTISKSGPSLLRCIDSLHVSPT